jgi:hypothetical protein
LRHKFENFIGHASAIDRSGIEFVKAAQKILVLKLKSLRYRAQLQSSEDEVDADSGELEFDDRDVCFWDRGEFFDSTWRRHSFEYVREIGEKIFSVDVFGNHHKCIDVRA